MEAISVTANKVSARDRGPRQATSITMVTARNNAVNSIVAPDPNQLTALYKKPPNSAIAEVTVGKVLKSL
jgi:hypothetical protein